MSEFSGAPFRSPSPGEAPEGAGGRPGEHLCAVTYQGEFETPWDGTAVAVRAHARALATTKIPVLLRSFSGMATDAYGSVRPVHQVGLDPSVAREVESLLKTTARAYFPMIKHAVVSSSEHLKQLVIPRGAIAMGGIEESAKMRSFIFDSTILYTVWERDRIDPGIAKTMTRVADNWVPCDSNRRTLIASGVPEDRVHVVPHPYDRADPVLRLRARAPDTQWRKFYSIGRWEPRKGYVELIEAFLRAFTPKDNAILTIKYTGGNWPDYPTPDEAVARAYAQGPILANGWTLARIRERVRLIEGRFPRSRVLELHYRNNIYVSASHGEAWCLPAFEAALAGNNVCYVPSGGVEDYLGSGHSVVTTDGLDVAPASYKWEPGALWTGYAVFDLARALVRSHAPTVTHDRPDSIALDRYTLEAVGKVMRERVLAVSKRKPEIAQYYQGL